MASSGSCGARTASARSGTSIRATANRQHFGFAAQDSYQGLSAKYAIKGGKIVESFGNAPLEWTAYKSGDKTLLARSDEFGFANYEIIPVPAELVNPGSVKR